MGSTLRCRWQCWDVFSEQHSVSCTGRVCTCRKVFWGPSDGSRMLMMPKTDYSRRHIDALNPAPSSVSSSSGFPLPGQPPLLRRLPPLHAQVLWWQSEGCGCCRHRLRHRLRGRSAQSLWHRGAYQTNTIVYGTNKD